MNTDVPAVPCCSLCGVLETPKDQQAHGFSTDAWGYPHVEVLVDKRPHEETFSVSFLERNFPKEYTFPMTFVGKLVP